MPAGDNSGAGSPTGGSRLLKGAPLGQEYRGIALKCDAGAMLYLALPNLRPRRWI